MSFDQLGLSDKVLQAVTASGYTQPTPIQEQAIPHVMSRRDVLGIAQTGTGKTAAFTLPMLTLLENGRARARMPRTLILEPTRELAAQVEENFIKYGVNHKLSVALVIGGVSFGDQDVKISRGVDVLIATPGRLLDHFERGKLLLTGVELLVIDEADRMLDMGFIPDIERIVKLTPFTRQTLFFSATMPPEIQRLSDKFLSNPVKIEVARAASAAQTITQRLVATGVDAASKRDTLRALIRDATDLQNAIIFCNRKRDVAVLHRSLVQHGLNAVALHGDMDQRARTLALDSFRSGETKILVASDVAARGLDIPAVSHVFNYDVPHHAEDYVHRIGRTGRAGRSGASFTLVARGDEKSLAAIQSLIGNDVPWDGPKTVAGGDRPDRADRGESEREGRSGGRRGGRRERTDAEPATTTARAPRSRGGRGAAQGEVEAEAEAEPAVVETVAEKPTEQNPAGQRRARPARAEPRNEPRAAPEPREQRLPRGRDRGHDQEDAVGAPGFGDHVPAFLLRSAAIKPKK